MSRHELRNFKVAFQVYPVDILLVFLMSLNLQVIFGIDFIYSMEIFLKIKMYGLLGIIQYPVFTLVQSVWESPSFGHSGKV